MTYKTRPLEAFTKSKDLRAKHYQDVMTAREQGKLVVLGTANMPWELVEGLGPYEALEGEPYGATVAQYPELALECAEATDARGYGRDVCAYVRSYWGSMFLNKTPWGKFPRPHFVVSYYFSHCGAQEKWWRVAAETTNVPMFCIDFPRFKSLDVTLDPQRLERFRQYLITQFNEFIEWGEKVTGKKYDDNKLIEGVINKRRSQYLWGQVCDLQRTVPAPLNVRLIFNLMMPRVLLSARKESADYCTALLDEVKARVADGIASQPEEKARFLHDFVPPYIGMDILRYFEDYGAALVVSQYAFNWGGGLTDEGVWGVVEPFGELGHPPRNRQEALWDIANWDLKRDTWLSMFSTPSRVSAAQHFVKNWKCNGAVYHFNRGEKGGIIGVLDAQLSLKRAGIPTMMYEASATDRRDIDMVKVKDAIDAFMESMGLKNAMARAK
ncbi:MAG: 2-hydroxyacyl-CoA dehydratase [Chloroflexi bacterium]|nr:2-hydroxyacyl-CoA dehydratase [Chloroflexota bacterium]